MKKLNSSCAAGLYKYSSEILCRRHSGTFKVSIRAGEWLGGKEHLLPSLTTQVPSPECTWWKNRANFCDLSFDHHTLHTQTHCTVKFPLEAVDAEGAGEWKQFIRREGRTEGNIRGQTEMSQGGEVCH